MKIQKAIELAVEGGFWLKNLQKTYDDAQIKSFVFQPDFWQALGKNMGWENRQHPYWSLTLLKEYDTHIEHGGISSKRLHPWQAQMHRLIDHLAEGGTIDSFFDKL